MSPKKAITTLAIIILICGLFFVYLFTSGKIFFQPPNKDIKKTERPLTPEEKSQQVINLSDKLKQLDTSTATPAQKAQEVVNLSKKIKQLDTSTATPAQKAQEVMNLSEKLKQLDNGN